MLMQFICFSQAAKFAVTNLFLQNSLNALQRKDCFRASERIPILHSREVKTNIVDSGLLTMIDDCRVDQVLALLANA